MMPRPPRSTRTDTLLPYPTRCRAPLATALLALPAVQPDRPALGPLQPAARGTKGTLRGPRRPEHRRHPGRPRRGAGAAEPLGEDQPQPARRRHPARPIRRAGADAGPGRRLPLRPTPVLRAYAPRHDGDQPPGYTAEPRRDSRGYRKSTRLNSS